MEVELKEVQENELMEYAQMVLVLCKQHFELRTQVGYADYNNEAENYNCYNILGDFNRKGTHFYFITCNSKNIGTIASYEQNSEVNDEPIIYVDSLYILPEYRNMGVGKKVMAYLKNKVRPKKIELHCLYGNEAELFYEKIGAKKVKIVYSF